MLKSFTDDDQARLLRGFEERLAQEARAMKSSRVAKRYARALLGLSDDRNQLETWGAELERLARIGRRS